MRPALGAALILAAAALWGSLGLFGRLAFERGVSPAELASVRAALAFLFALPLLAWQPRALRVRPRDLPLLLAYGTVSVALFYWIYLAAVDRLPLAVAAALLYTAPAFVVAIAWVMRWEPVRLPRLVPLGMVLVGALLVTGAWRVLGTGIDPVGAALGLGSGLAYALYTAIGKRIRGRYDALTTILWAYGIGAAVLAIAAPPWWVLIDHPDARGLIFLMALGPTFLAALFFFRGLHHIDASAASMLATIEPVVAALLGLVWLGEALTVDAVAGIALIVAAAVWLSKRSRGQQGSRAWP
ncbi:MAG TPA: EamA family transporter [Longimicrobiales bacterium]|nr:EamA family transporter [Longimicrobiales bacterium]